MSGHHHHDHGETSAKRMLVTMLLNFSITLVEVIGGVMSGSLSLISDTLQNLSDGVAIVISYVLLRLRKTPKTTHIPLVLEMLL